MKKEFVPYEIALALKELGFDYCCFCSYSSEGKLADSYGTYYRMLPDEDVVIAPLYQQAFEWFRNEYELHGEVKMYIPQEGELDGCYTYIPVVGYSLDYKRESHVGDKFYPSYRKAEDACLLKLIELCKNK